MTGDLGILKPHRGPYFFLPLHGIVQEVYMLPRIAKCLILDILPASCESQKSAEWKGENNCIP